MASSFTSFGNETFVEDFSETNFQGTENVSSKVVTNELSYLLPDIEPPLKQLVKKYDDSATLERVRWL